MSDKQETSSLAVRMPQPRGRAGFVVLLALAWFQVAFASHQFEHVTGDLFDICTLCKHMERHDAAIAQDATDFLPAASLQLQLLQPVVPAPAAVLRNYEARAPPSA